MNNLDLAGSHLDDVEHFLELTPNDEGMLRALVVAEHYYFEMCAKVTPSDYFVVYDPERDPAMRLWLAKAVLRDRALHG